MAREKLVSADVFEGLFEDDKAVIYAVDDKLKLTYCNAAWDRFALANDGAAAVRGLQIGSDLARVIPLPLREFYLAAFAGVRRSGKPWEHEYECSSPSFLRRFHMRVYSFSEDRPGSPLVVVNSLLTEVPHPSPANAGSTSDFWSSEGLIIMCCHCRRTRSRRDPSNWVWMPQFVRDPPARVSHGLCTVCMRVYYGE